MHCYNCGKQITDRNSAISLDDLNWSHTECLHSQKQLMEEVEFVVDPFDTYEANELPPKRMPAPITVFDNKPVTGRTPHELWEAIQHGAIVCTDIDKYIAKLRPADSTETCYVFWDEAEQMSMPYASEAIAREALVAYIKDYL